MSARPSVTAITLRSSLLRAALCVLFSSSLMAVQAPSALAHAAFLDSTPEAGVRLRSSPQQIELRFTEPLNRALSEATLVNVGTGKRIVATKLPARSNRELSLRPAASLPRAPYRVEWHTVSTVDGHALEGSFSFGVRTAAAGGEHELEQSPLAREGWVRIGFRALLYASLFFFAGGVLNAVLLSRRDPVSWLLPRRLRRELAHAGRDPETFARRTWARTIDAGWLAAGAAAATALVEAADAGGGLTLNNTSDFLLTNGAGLARVGSVIALLMAVLHATRLPVAAAAWIAIGFLTVALSGHANSADPRFAAVTTDWAHLLAAAVWIGGLAQLALAWLPVVGRAGRDLRIAVMRAVLSRFGRVALPAFVVVAATGLTNALIELERPDALWESAYGRVLALKIALVASIACASYWHALRMRPKLMSANPHASAPLERRHWRLLSAEPLLALAVVVAASALVAFPLPPRQLAEAGEARETRPCDPCPLPEPRPDELAVAEQAGSRIAAFWLRRDGGRLSGTLRLLDSEAKPIETPVRLLGGELDRCGVGCRRFTLNAAGRGITIAAEEKGQEYRASVPALWQATANARARRLLERAQAVMRGLRTLRETERLTSGPGTYVRTDYRFEAPNRFAYRTSSGSQSITIGRRQWTRVRGYPWQSQPFGGFGAFRTRSFFRWTPYARAARLLDVHRIGKRQIAEVALMDQATPVWFRLRIDLLTMRVREDRMITKAHFMSRRYFAFDRPLEIGPPPRSVPVP